MEGFKGIMHYCGIAPELVISGREIRKTVEMAIPFSDCPVKREAEKIRRVWLEKKIKEYLGINDTEHKL